MEFFCTLTNTGSAAGDEVVQVFHEAGTAIRAAAAAAQHPVPIRALVEFDRVSLQPGQTATLNFTLPEVAFALVTTDGNSTVYPGDRSIVFSRGNGVDVVVPVTL
jgi:hypothetical protein